MLPRELEERTVGADARVRDDDVDAAERARRRVAETCERVEVADVARLCDRAGEAEVVAASRREAELAASRVQHAGDRRADAAAGAGDDCRLPIEIHVVSSSGLRFG